MDTLARNFTEVIFCNQECISKFLSRYDQLSSQAGIYIYKDIT